MLVMIRAFFRVPNSLVCPHGHIPGRSGTGSSGWSGATRSRGGLCWPARPGAAPSSPAARLRPRRYSTACKILKRPRKNGSPHMDLLKRWSVGGVALIALSMGMPIAAHADTFLINQDNLGIGYVAMTGGTGFAASNTHAVPGPVVGAGL